VYSGFAKIFTLKCSNRPLNKGRSKRTRVRRALSSPEHARRAPPRAPVSRQAKPAPLPAPVPINPPGRRPYSSAHTRPHRSTRSPALPRTRRARDHPNPRHRRPASRALPSHARPSEETVHASVKLPEQGIGLCFTGEASPRSPDFTRPLVNVDQVNLCPILRFLAHIASTSPHGAHRAV
jgi:hypothetical protein